MSKAKITKKGGFECAPNGSRVETFAEGAIVSGQVAIWALRAKAASAMFDPVEETKVTPPTETKAKRTRKAKK